MDFPLINLSNIAMTAITNKIWTMLPRLNTKKPNSQPIIKITANRYKKLLMIKCFGLSTYS
jgi:hypothetical protein